MALFLILLNSVEEMHPPQPTGHFCQRAEELQVVATLKLIRASFSAAVTVGVGLGVLKNGKAGSSKQSQVLDIGD